MAIAVFPGAAGIDVRGAASLTQGFRLAMLIVAAACVVGGLVALMTISRGARTHGPVLDVQLARKPTTCLGRDEDTVGQLHG